MTKVFYWAKVWKITDIFRVFEVIWTSFQRFQINPSYRRELVKGVVISMNRLSCAETKILSITSRWGYQCQILLLLSGPSQVLGSHQDVDSPKTLVVVSVDVTDISWTNDADLSLISSNQPGWKEETVSLQILAEFRCHWTQHLLKITFSAKNVYAVLTQVDYVKDPLLLLSVNLFFLRFFRDRFLAATPGVYLWQNIE